MITFRQKPTHGDRHDGRELQNHMQSVRIPTIMACVVAAFTTTAAAAQNAQSVTISIGDSDSITGEIIDVTNDQISLQTTAGVFTIPTEGATCTGAACPAALTANPPSDEIVLTTEDNTLSIAGTLLGIEDDQYVLSTDAGVMRVAVEGMQCAGTGCIDTAVANSGDQTVSLSNGHTTIAGALLRMEENAYIIRHDTLGELRVRLDQFECSGDSCPTS